MNEQSPIGSADLYGQKLTRSLLSPLDAKKRTKSVDPIAIAFQPDAVEVELKKLPGAARIALYTILALLVGAFVWASIAKVDRAISARGKLVSQSRTEVLQPIKTSIIRSLDVEAGDFVKKGQILATLDSTVSKAELGQMNTKLRQLAAELQRIAAERAGKPYFPKNTDTENALQLEIYTRRQAEKEVRLFGFDARRSSLKAEEDVAHSQKEQIDIKLKLATTKLANAKKLVARSALPKIRLLEGQAEVAQLQAASKEKQNEMLKLSRQQDVVSLEKEFYLAEVLRKIEDRRLAILNERSQLEYELQKARKIDEFDDFSARTDAVILETTRKSVGSIVEAGEVILTLVPANNDMEVAIEMSARDVGWVTVGKPVRVKLDPFPFQRHGTLEGRLLSVSPDAFQRENAGQVQIYYKAKIAIEENKLRNLPSGFSLLPGITATAEIQIGERTILSFITDPLHKALDESLKEP